MIYPTFADIDREYKYALDYINSAKKCAYEYLKAVTIVVGSTSIMVGNKRPAVLTHEGDDVVVYESIDCCKLIESYGFEQLMDICQQVRNKHLVEEFGDGGES